jgi:Holliday junction DNA helicase RuvA
MFYYVSGTVAEMEAGLAVIDCGGVGFACYTTNYSLTHMKKGSQAKLFTYLNVKEDGMDLYGFTSQAELRSFKLLLGVNGVGPKAALSILSSTTPDQLAMCVVMGDEKTLTAAPGIGKKIAQRIILELKDKLSKDQEIGAFVPDGSGAAAMPAGNNGKLKEAAAALAVLGYGAQEVNTALKYVDVEHLSLEDIIRQALKQMIR